MGVSMKYNSYMKNVDTVFVTNLVPGSQQAREENMAGDFIWDLRFGYELNKHVKINGIINNLFNHIMTTRPADIRQLRLTMLQVTFKF
jgi:outer membrane receptor for ferrienterochelin and colicin